MATDENYRAEEWPEDEKVVLTDYEAEYLDEWGYPKHEIWNPQCEYPCCA